MANTTITALAALLAGTLLAPGCAAQAPAPASARTEHVVVISVDGLRGDALARYDAPTMRGLAREGSHSLEATTVVPSTTLPSHASMVTGVSPAAHGITWNTDLMRSHGPTAVPTIFSVARAAGLEAAAFFGKSKLRHLAASRALTHLEAPEELVLFEPGDRTVERVKEYLRDAAPNLLFIHLADLDVAGHAMGWMSAGYGEALGQVDRLVGSIIETTDAAFGAGNYTLILTSDHGGSERGHGTADPLELRIPWIAWGRGVAVGTRLDDVRTLDTAPTVLWLLGLTPPEWTEGAPLEMAFSAPAKAGVR